MVCLLGRHMKTAESEAAQTLVITVEIQRIC